MHYNNSIENNLSRKAVMSDLYRLTISEASDLLTKKEISVRELTGSVYQRIDAVEDTVRAFITITKETALSMADRAQKRLDLQVRDSAPTCAWHSARC